MPKRQARACLPEKATVPGHAPHSTREYGDKGERLAETYLKRRGLKLVARGYVTPVGEIDLIVRDGDTVVFVEVKRAQPSIRRAAGVSRRGQAAQDAAPRMVSARAGLDRPPVPL